jgi:hypothetical protein
MFSTIFSSLGILQMQVVYVRYCAVQLHLLLMKTHFTALHYTADFQHFLQCVDSSGSHVIVQWNGRNRI